MNCDAQALAAAPVATSSIALRAAATPDMVQTFLLLHGAGLNGDSFRAVRYYLELAGHRVFTPTLYGHGLPNPPAHVSHQEVLDHLIAFLDTNGLHNYRQLTVVCWSLGGVWGQLLATRRFSSIARVIFFDAFVLNPGESVMSCMRSFIGEAGVAEFAKAKDAVHNTFQFPYALFESVTPELGPDARQHFYEQYAGWPEPWDVSEEVPNPQAIRQALAEIHLDLWLASAVALPCSYILAPNDLMFGESFWSAIADRLGPFCRRVSLPVGGHYAPFSQPAALARAILEAAGEQHLPDFAELEQRLWCSTSESLQQPEAGEAPETIAAREIA